MASRKFQQFRLSIIPQVVELWAVVRCPNVAGTITPKLQTWNPVTQLYSDADVVSSGSESGLLPIVRVGVGLWQFNFGSKGAFAQTDIYRRWLEMSLTTYNSTGIPTIANAGIVTNVGAVGPNIAATTNNGGFVFSNLVEVQLVNAAGFAADPTANDVIVFRFTAQNSSSK